MQFCDFGASGISIHSLRMEGDQTLEMRIRSAILISIHSLRMEGDSYCHFFTHSIRHFNPLPPHGGRPKHNANVNWSHVISIHSLRMEGDRYHLFPCTGRKDFNPLPPHGGRPAYCKLERVGEWDFNPLPPHGGRPARRSLYKPKITFQSTPSAWRETCKYRPCNPSGILFQSTPSAWRETQSLIL